MVTQRVTLRRILNILDSFIPLEDIIHPLWSLPPFIRVVLALEKEATVYQIVESLAKETRGALVLRHQSVSNWLKRSEQWNLVTHEVRSKGKRRVRYYRLTEKGELLMKAYFTACHAIEKELEEAKFFKKSPQKNVRNT